MLKPNRTKDGFTLVEMIIAMGILITGVLGMGVLAAELLGDLRHSDIRMRATHVVDDRLSLISLDPRYELLDSLYEETQDSLVGLPGYSRKTVIVQSKQTGNSGRTTDYKVITVLVSGPVLPQPVSRSITVGAP